jgi:hypothetical protein
MLDPVSKITGAKRARGKVQVMEYLPSKHRSLNQTPVPRIMKEKEKI